MFIHEHQGIAPRKVDPGKYELLKLCEGTKVRHGILCATPSILTQREKYRDRAMERIDEY
jgi:hypothetical protein